VQVAGTSRAHVVTSAGHVLATLRVHIATRFPRPSLHTRFDSSLIPFSFPLFSPYSTLQTLSFLIEPALPQCTHSIIDHVRSGAFGGGGLVLAFTTSCRLPWIDLRLLGALPENPYSEPATASRQQTSRSPKASSDEVCFFVGASMHWAITRR
jgi:hypothetical protein